MPRKSHRRRRRPGKYRGGRAIINHKDYTRRDYISPGRLVAWAEWVEEREDRGNGNPKTVSKV